MGSGWCTRRLLVLRVGFCAVDIWSSPVVKHISILVVVIPVLKPIPLIVPCVLLVPSVSIEALSVLIVFVTAYICAIVSEIWFRTV